MPSPGPRIDSNIIEITEGDRLHLSAEDWQALEATLGKPIFEGARRSLRNHCKQFLVERKLELAAVSLRDTEKLLRTLATMSDARVAEGEARRRIYRHLADKKIEVDLNLDAGRDGTWSAPEQPHITRLTQRMAAEVIVHLRNAVVEAKAELAEELKGPRNKAFRPGLAIERFLLALRSWARKYDLPSSTHNRNNARATPFSRFLFALHKCFPAHLRERAASPEALQYRLNKLIREQKQHT